MVRLNGRGARLRLGTVRLGGVALQVELLALAVGQRHRSNVAHRLKTLNAHDLKVLFRAI